MPEPQGQIRGRMLARETAAFAAGLCVLVFAQLVLTHGRALISRPLWFDECVTSLLANDPSFAHELQSLTQAEPNTPGLFLFLRPLQLGGAISPTTLRLFSLGCICLAVVGFYACMRTFVGMPLAIAASLLVWSHPLVMRHAFEARYYAPMMTCTVAFALALRARGRFAGFLIAAASLGLCMIHYFGIIILALMLLAHWLASRQRWRELLPALAGPAALVLWIPVFLRQRESFHVTWVPALSASVAKGFIGEVLPASMIMLLCISVAFMLAFKTRGPRQSQSLPVALLSLLALPVILLVITVTVQPVLIGRYAIVFALGLCALIAVLLRPAPRVAVWIVCGMAVLMSCINLNQLTTAAREETAGLEALATSIQANAKGRPVLFADGRLLLPMYYGLPETSRASRFLDFDSGDPFNLFVSDVIRNVTSRYPGPSVTPQADAGQMPSFLLVPCPTAPSPGKLFPEHAVHQINSRLYELTRVKTAQADN